MSSSMCSKCSSKQCIVQSGFSNGIFEKTTNRKHLRSPFLQSHILLVHNLVPDWRQVDLLKIKFVIFFLELFENC